MQEDVRKALLEATRSALRARGASVAYVEVDGDTLIVGRGAERQTTAVGDLAAAWNLLPPEDRQRRLEAAVDRALAGTIVTRVPRERVIGAWLAAAVLSMVALGSVTWASAEVGRAAERRKLREQPPAPAPESAASAASRKQAVCAGVRKRVVSGAPFGPYDAEGWIVEIWLGREDGSLGPADPAFGPLASGAVKPEALTGPSVERGDVSVMPPEPPPGGDATTAPGGALIQLRGGYASAFVDPAHRPRFVSFANTIFQESKAQLGAMWARCGELPWHDLGAWYRGPDRGGAAGVMLFQAGRYGDAGAVYPTAPGGAANNLGGLMGRSRRGVDEAAMRQGILELGGKVDAPPAGGVTITFPLAGYTLATSASRSLAAHIDRAAP